MCVFVPSPKTRFQVDWRLLVKERIPNIGITIGILGFDDFFQWFFFGFWVFATSLLCKMGELAGRVFCGFSCWRWHMTFDTWHLTCDTWTITFLSSFLSVLVLMLLSAHIERFIVTCKRDYFYYQCSTIFWVFLNSLRNVDWFHFIISKEHNSNGQQTIFSKLVRNTWRCSLASSVLPTTGCSYLHLISILKSTHWTSAWRY